MADKTPVRVVFNASNVATGLAEFQSGDTVGTAFGGTGLTSIGSAGQIIKVNAAGNALEFSDQGDVAITNLVAPTNADLTFSTSGTGNIVLDQITLSGTTFSSTDSSSININEGLIVDGTLNVSGATVLAGLTFPTSDGSSGQVLQTNGSGTLSFASVSVGDLSFVGSTIASPSNADLTIDPSGTGSIKLNANTDITGNLTVTGTLDLGDSNFTNVGSIQLDSISGDGDTNTSITFSGSDVITIATGGSGRLTIGDGALSPVTTNQIDLGTASLEYKDAFFDGTVTTDALTVSGTSTLAETTITTTTTGDSLLITTSEDSNSAAPVITLKRNSSSPADADYLGRLNFKGENDADQAVTYARISGKILDASDGSEDGAIEFNTIKAGSATITARLNSDELKLLNGTSLDVNGAGTFAGVMTATSVTSNDFTSNGSNADITLAPQGTGNINLTAGADVVIPANIGIILDGSGAEKIESDGTDISISVGSNGDINIPADIGLTFGDDGEKIEGDGTDLTITGNNIKLTATADVVIPSNVGLHFTDANEKIESDGSKLIITSGGTAFNLPTSDGTAGQALVTDGAGNLSFDSVSTTVSDDTLATVRNNKSLGTATRTIDSINATFIDSAFYFLVHNDLVNEVISAEMLAVTNNDTASFLGNRRGITSSGTTVPTLATDVSNGQFRVRATGTSADCKASFYKVAMSSSTTDATRGNTVTTSNTDVDSASESIDTFAHASFRGAKYFISVDNDSKTEMDVVEALVVHNGSDAFILAYGNNTSGSNPLITLTAAISGSNVVVSAAGNEPNLNLTIHKILLKDNMTAESNANQKAFAAVTISSTATAIDTMDLDDGNGAVYFIVGANTSEGAYSIQEVYTAATPGVPAVAKGPFVSTKSSHQLDFTAGFKTTTENSLELFASSTSGGSTTVSGYRISALAG